MVKWEPFDYQKDLADEAHKILSEYGLVYLAAEERTGKTISSLLVYEKCTEPKNILIVTKKAALDGWKEVLDNCDSWLKNNYTVINYHSVDKVGRVSFDGLILDESHSYISSYPKRSSIWKKVSSYTNNKPIIYCSATPYAQGEQLLFNQFALSSFSPWNKYKSFYSWYEDYAERDAAGTTDSFYIRGRMIKSYKVVKSDLIHDEVGHLFITKTRKELGFSEEPEDVIHYIELGEQTKVAYNILMKSKVLDFEVDDVEYSIVCDTGQRTKMALHMLEGGGLKSEDEYIVLNSREKIDYILKNWGDSDNVCIMYQYVVEGIKLKKEFKNCVILQGITYAEGVDLSHIEHMVVYSQDWSTARHTQRRARQANINRDTEIKVHFLLVKKAVSEQVYNTVSKNKVNFVDSLFYQEEL